MKVVCPRCKAPVPAQHVNVAKLVAKCLGCDDVFTFEPQMRSDSGELPRPPTITVSPEGVVEATTGVTYRDAASRGPLTITYRARQLGALFGLAFSFVWNGFLAFFYAGALASGELSPVLLFPILHVAAGIFIFYTSLASLLNRTVVSIDGARLRVRHGPLWLPGNRDVEVAQLRQLFVRTHRGGRRGAAVTHSVDADVDGVDVRLLGGILEEHEAQFIERTIERHLAIVDDAGRK